MSTGKTTQTFGRWDEAIEDAKKHIRRLQAAIRTLEENKQKGEHWPGTSAKGKGFCAGQ